MLYHLFKLHNADLLHCNEIYNDDENVLGRGRLLGLKYITRLPQQKQVEPLSRMHAE